MAFVLVLAAVLALVVLLTRLLLLLLLGLAGLLDMTLMWSVSLKDVRVAAVAAAEVLSMLFDSAVDGVSPSLVFSISSFSSIATGNGNSIFFFRDSTCMPSN
jgi:hypothetical protein